MPETVKEIKHEDWSEFHLRKEDFPDWILGLESSKDEDEAQELLEVWTPEQWMEYYLCIADILSVFAKVDLRAMLGSYAKSGKKDLSPLRSIMAIYVHLNRMILSYEPKKISSFHHKGKEFIIPKDLIDTVGRIWTGAEMDSMTAIEALQVEHVMNSKDKEGNFILKDRKYRTDTALLAALSRMLIKGEGDWGLGRIEEMPLDMMTRRKWLDRRIKLFSDISMDVGLDIAFFLDSSKQTFIATRIYSTPSQSLRNRLLRHIKKSAIGKSGLYGVGTAS